MFDKNENKYFWQKNILVFLSEYDSEIKERIDSWAYEHSCNVTIGDGKSSDLIMIPAFIILIDRTQLDDEKYKEFIKFKKETSSSNNSNKIIKEGNYCIFLDNLKMQENPEIDFVTQISRSNKLATDFIINTLDYLYALLQST